jgi:hypothetical protein
MKKDLTTRQRIIQMLLDRWRQKHEHKELTLPTPLFSEKPKIKIGKARSASK